MPAIRIRTPHASLGLDLARRLEEAGYAGVQLCTSDEVTSYKVVHRPGISIAALRQITEVITPFVPSSWEPSADALPAGVDVELNLGDAQPLRRWSVQVHVEDQPLGEGARQALGDLGFAVSDVSVRPVERAGLSFGGASAFARHLVRWWASQIGITLVEQKLWDDDDSDLFVDLLTAEQQALPVTERYGIVVQTDDAQAGEELAAELRDQGLSCTLEAGEPSRIGVHPGPFKRNPKVSSALRAALEKVVSTRGIDATKFPIVAPSDERSDQLRATVQLPLRAVAEGRLRPYGGDVAERFSVVLRADDAEAAAPLADELRALGFRSVRVAAHPHGPSAWAVGLGGLTRESVLGLQLLSTLERAKPASYGPLAAFPSPKSEDDDTIVVEVGFTALDEATRARRLRAALATCRIKVVCGRETEPKPLMEKLRAAGARDVSIMRHRRSPGARLVYGGAPPSALAAIAALAEPLVEGRFDSACSWHSGDLDVFIEVPSVVAPVAAAPSSSAIPVADWRAPQGGLRVEPRAFVAVEADHVRVGRLRLPRRATPHELAPPRSHVEGYCLDARTAETVLHVARSVVLGEPCALEGETSTSKTSAILYLAALLGQPVVRINLHGQTDGGELLGRYEPAEGAKGGVFRWRDGAIVRAMREGFWIILDELNLAEPQVLERLNSLLERTPSLVLTEHDQRVYGGRGLPIHPDFRLFATSNPAEYAGRSVLSPAYRDRWRGYRMVPLPGEGEYVAMLRLLLLGEHPTIALQGAAWAAPAAQRPQYPRLGALEGIEALVVPLARFHASMEQAARRGPDGVARLGSRRREPYVFTRRGLLSLLDHVERLVEHEGWESASLELREALQRVYVDRMAEQADRVVAFQLLDAAGLGPRTWVLPCPPAADGEAAATSASSDDEAVDAEDDELLDLFAETA